MHAIDVILRDHEKIRALLKDVQKQSKESEQQRKRFFMELSSLLLRHEKMEQEFLYPTLKEMDQFDDVIDHLLDEEKKAEKAIKKLSDFSLPTNEWLKLLIDLKGDVSHHANEEEEKLFPRVLKLVPENILKELGNEMQAFKNKARHPKL